MGQSGLVRINELNKALAEAKTIQDVAKIRVQMEILAKTLAPRFVGERMKASIGYLEACRKHGEWWRELDNKHPAHVTKVTSGNEFIDFIAAGFKHRMEAKRCAAIAEPEFQQDYEIYIQGCEEDNKYPTLSGAYTVWKTINIDNGYQPPEWIDSQIMIGDFREADIPPNSIDVIFTDPPYEEKALELYEALSERAQDWLVEGGWCLAYAGQWALPKVIDALSKHLTYFWTAAIIHSGDKSYMRKHRIRVGWKPILIFHKPKLEIDWGSIEDIVTGKQEKGLHPWQQSEIEARHFLRHFCRPGGVVLDPMCGSGTTLTVAKELGYRYIGIEIDRESGEKAMERLNDTKAVR